MTTVAEPGSVEDVRQGAEAWKRLIESQVLDGFRWVCSYRGVADFAKGMQRRSFTFDRAAGAWVPSP